MRSHHLPMLPMLLLIVGGCGASKEETNYSPTTGKVIKDITLRNVSFERGPSGQMTISYDVEWASPSDKTVILGFETFDKEGMVTGNVVAYPNFNGTMFASGKVPVPPGTLGFRSMLTVEGAPRKPKANLN